jgi:hypothetical protein
MYQKPGFAIHPRAQFRQSPTPKAPIPFGRRTWVSPPKPTMWQQCMRALWLILTA